jgi:hypothetical protein
MIVSDMMGVSTRCAESSKSTLGSFGCPFKFGLPNGVILVKKGYKIPASTDVTAEFMTGLVQNGTIIPLLNAFSFEPVNEDDVLETSATGVNDLARKGLTSLMFTFKKGIEYERAMENLTGFGAFDVWVVDNDGNMLGVDEGGDFAGWTAGLVLAKSKTWNTGSESEGKAIEIQLTQPGERAYVTWLAAKELGFFIPSNIDGVNAVRVTFEDANGAVPPANSDTSVSVRVLASDGSTPVLGITDGQFRVRVDGGADLATASSEVGDGYYTITAPVASGELTVDLYDDTAGVDTINVADILFTGSGVATVA